MNVFFTENYSLSFFFFLENNSRYLNFLPRAFEWHSARMTLHDETERSVNRCRGNSPGGEDGGDPRSFRSIAN